MGKFQKGNPGKPKGAVSKTTKLMVSVKDVVLNAFHELQADPKVNLVEWAKTNPTGFYQIAAKLIPTNIQAEVTKTVVKVKTPDDGPEDAKIIEEK